MAVVALFDLVRDQNMVAVILLGDQIHVEVAR